MKPEVSTLKISIKFDKLDQLTKKGDKAHITDTGRKEWGGITSLQILK